MPADLLGRSGRARRRPPESHQRRGPAPGRGQPFLQAGIRTPGHRRRGQAGRGLFGEQGRRPAGEEGGRHRGRGPHRRHQRENRGVEGPDRARAAVPARHRPPKQSARGAHDHRPPVRARARQAAEAGDRPGHRRCPSAASHGNRSQRLPPQRRSQLSLRDRAHPRAPLIATDDARGGAPRRARRHRLHHAHAHRRGQRLLRARSRVGPARPVPAAGRHQLRPVHGPGTPAPGRPARTALHDVRGAEAC